VGPREKAWGEIMRFGSNTTEIGRKSRFFWGKVFLTTFAAQE
jgi:hypothetical protein